MRSQLQISTQRTYNLTNIFVIHTVPAKKWRQGLQLYEASISNCTQTVSPIMPGQYLNLYQDSTSNYTMTEPQIMPRCNSNYIKRILQIMPWHCPRLGHYCCLSHPFQFISQLSFYHFMPHGVSQGCTNPGCKVTQVSYCIWKHLIFVSLQYGTCFMSPFWHLQILKWLPDFWKICGPLVWATHRNIQ